MQVFINKLILLILFCRLNNYENSSKTINKKRSIYVIEKYIYKHLIYVKGKTIKIASKFHMFQFVSNN